jgi:hypothetical protein
MPFLKEQEQAQGSKNLWSETDTEPLVQVI